MSDEATPPTDEAPEPKTTSETRLRLWPAIVLAVIQIVSTIVARQYGDTNLTILIGAIVVPLLMVILIGVWWLAFSRAPWVDRFVGAVIVLIAMIFPAVNTIAPEHFLPRVALIMIPGILVAFLLTSRMPWRVQRITALVVIVAVTGVASMLRVDAIHGDVSLTLSWRWEPTLEEAAAEALGSSEDFASGTADIASAATPEDWPGFRGANRDGRNLVSVFNTDWESNPPQELWRRPVGLGWSSFSVVGDYVFTQEQRGGYELVVCYESATGEEVWVNAIDSRFEDQMGDGPRATPTFVNGRLYTQGASGEVQCLDAATGETIWSSDLRDETGAKIPTWGFSSSPLVAAGRVIVYAGTNSSSAVAAFDQETGELAWTSGSGNHGYSSGQLLTLYETPQVVMVSNFGLQSLRPEDGEVLWENAWEISDLPRCVQPGIVGEGGILLPSFSPSGANGTKRVNVTYADGIWTAEEDWTATRFRPYFNDFVTHDGNLYGYDNSSFKSVNLETGEENWRGPRLGGQVLLLAAMDTLLILTEKGEVVLAETSPEAFTEIARIEALDSKTWNHPVVAHGRLFVRNDNEAVCYTLPTE